MGARDEETQLLPGIEVTPTRPPLNEAEEQAEARYAPIIAEINAEYEANPSAFEH